MSLHFYNQTPISSSKNLLPYLLKVLGLPHMLLAHKHPKKVKSIQIMITKNIFYLNFKFSNVDTKDSLASHLIKLLNRYLKYSDWQLQHLCILVLSGLYSQLPSLPKLQFTKIPSGLFSCLLTFSFPTILSSSAACYLLSSLSYFVLN